MTPDLTRLRAGVAGVDITPDRPLPLEGYGARLGPATGTLDPVEARAIVFDDGVGRAALVAADLCGLEAPSVDRIRRAVDSAAGIPGDRVMVTFSHTHGAPAVTPFAGVAVDAAYVAWLEQRLAGAVVAAAERLTPVTVGTGEGAMDFNVNRRRRTPDGMVMRANPAAPVDRRVRVLRVDPAGAPPPPGTLGGSALPQAEPLAVLFSYACHATVLGAENTRYTADYPGAARRFVERSYRTDAGRRNGANGSPGELAGEAPTTAALFLPACFGNLRPHLLRPDGSFRGGTDHELRVLGRLLGSEVVQVAERARSEPVREIAVGRRQVFLPYGPPHAPSRVGGPAGEVVEVQVLRLGRHWLVATPGETTLEIGLSIERGLVELGLAHPERGDLALAIGYANGYVGYLCSASLQVEGGYEPNDYAGYGRTAPFAPQIEAALVNAALETALALAGSQPAPAA